MLETINKENFSQVLSRFTTTELETLVEKFPYFQQAHLLLAKKYQDQNHPKFDQQLQLAALYTHDRDLFYSIFNDKELVAQVAQLTHELYVEKLPEIPQQENPVEAELQTAEEKEELFNPAVEEEKTVFELSPEVAQEVVIQDEQPVLEVSTTETEPVVEPPVLTLEPEPEAVAEDEFSVEEPHTFNEWLQAYNKSEPLKIELKQPEIPVEVEKQDQELEKLYVANIPVNLQELVEEETHYSKGLDRFIEEQIQKHKAPPVKSPVSDNDLDPELITETMAKVYEMQKKYSKAIRSYEILALKYPEKNDFFAARINYLKNIT